MRILIDFGAIKTGGGVQLALNFIDKLQSVSSLHHSIYLLIPDVGYLAEKKLDGNYAGIFVSPSNYLRRAFFEYVALQKIIKLKKIDVIFTFFGAGVPHGPRVKSVVTVAYPIICYPESPYWKYLAFKKRLSKNIINMFRRIRLRKASMIIVETEVMKKRISKSVHFPSRNIHVLPPTPSSYVHGIDSITKPFRGHFSFISGKDPHKNLWRLYDVALELRKKSFNSFLFLLTIRRDEFLDLLKTHNIDFVFLDNHFRFMGAIHPKELMDLYHDSDCVVSLSDLESFSNNYMEAWKIGLPIIASDRDFARAICGDSAVYVEPHDPVNIAQGMIKIASDPKLRISLVTQGRLKLSSLPSEDQRFKSVLDIITSLDGHKYE